MRLNKIEAALEALGWNGEITNVSIKDENGVCNVSFSVTKEKSDKNKIEEDVKIYPIKTLSSTVENRQLKSEPKQETLFDYIARANIAEALKEEKKEDTIVPARQKWKTPKPRPVIRYVFFKSKDQAQSFADEYSKDFEYIDAQTMKGTIPAIPYTIKKNKGDQELYSKGYYWILEFRMNGREFETLEACEDLKKKENSMRGGACIRYKEVV